MSYDYNGLVSQITNHRQNARSILSKGDKAKALEELQQSVDAFATLSTHCPMTPLLWMQYSEDASQLVELGMTMDNSDKDPDSKALANQAGNETKLQTLELGLQEFPGCALLHHFYLKLLFLLLQHENNDSNEQNNNEQKIKAAVDNALMHIGRGSHGNESDLVVHIYNACTEHYKKVGKLDECRKLFLLRAAIPIKNGNDALMEQVQEFFSASSSQNSDMLALLEEARRNVSRTFSGLQSLEDDVDAAMNEEGILSRYDIEDCNDWDTIVNKSQGRYWMGLGGAKSADAFIKYAKMCAGYKRRRKDEADHENARHQEKLVRSLAESIYERGVSECPTVESLWVAYIQHLTDNNPILLPGVCNRAVRNCPYSMLLYGLKMKSFDTLAETGRGVFDPEHVMGVVKEAVELKFLGSQEALLEIHLTAIRSVKRWIQKKVWGIVAEPEPVSNKESQKKINIKNAHYDGADKRREDKQEASEQRHLSQDDEQEVQDLVEDIREMYDATDSFLRNNYKDWSVGRALLWKDRADTEAYLLEPLDCCFQDEEGPEGKKEKQALNCFETLVRAHQPAHADVFTAYIQYVMGTLSGLSATQIVATLRMVRGLYQRALFLVKKIQTQEEVVTGFRSHNIALHNLCHNYLEFEKTFGSEESHKYAAKAVAAKLRAPMQQRHDQNQATNVAQQLQTDSVVESELVSQNQKRKAEDLDVGSAEAEKDSKKAKLAEAQNDDVKPIEIDKGGADSKRFQSHTEHKVRVGKVNYPAHPFTVHVSNLSPETEDMDLVDGFRACGTIVHARILRDKHTGHPRGSGFVQFEEREAVATALELNEVLSMHEKVVRVERSHIPAVVGIVPPGRHRVRPKGEGRYSKRNEKRKEKVKHAHVDEKDTDNSPKDAGATRSPTADVSASTQEKKTTPVSKATSNVLAFKPRGLKGRHKPHLDLS